MYIAKGEGRNKSGFVKYTVWVECTLTIRYTANLWHLGLHVDVLRSWQDCQKKYSSSLARFLACEILISQWESQQQKACWESRWDLGKFPKISSLCYRDSWQVFGCQESWPIFGQWDLGNLASQKCTKILAEILVKILQGKLSNIMKIWYQQKPEVVTGIETDFYCWLITSVLVKKYMQL